MPEGLCAALIVFSGVYGFLFAWAICNQHRPFWGGFLDGLTLRFLWRGIR